jgi:hypothetical protein
VRRYSSGERPLLAASEARFFMAGLSRIPSTALIFVKLAWPITKPVLVFLPVGRFYFGMNRILSHFERFAIAIVYGPAGRQRLVSDSGLNGPIELCRQQGCS